MDTSESRCSRKSSTRGFIPGGQAWLQVAKDYPMKLPGEGRGKKETDPDTLDGMMYSDFGHQSFTGALLNSLMIWKYLTGEELTELKLSATQPEVPQQAKKDGDVGPAAVSGKARRSIDRSRGAEDSLTNAFSLARCSGLRLRVEGERSGVRGVG